MKRGQNPLYPESEGKGLMGAYEEAALMDDSAETFGGTGKRRAVDGRENDREADLEFMKDVRRRKREFDARDREIMGDYWRRLGELRRRKKAGEISRREFRRLKKELVRETDRRNWGNLGKFWFGG